MDTFKKFKVPIIIVIIYFALALWLPNTAKRSITVIVFISVIMEVLLRKSHNKVWPEEDL